MNLHGVVERIAEFIEVEADDALIDLAPRHSSFEFMSAHKGPYHPGSSWCRNSVS